MFGVINDELSLDSTLPAVTFVGGRWNVTTQQARPRQQLVLPRQTGRRMARSEHRRGAQRKMRPHSCVPTNVSEPPGCLRDEDCCAYPHNPSIYSGVFCDAPAGYPTARKRGVRLPKVCVHNGAQADSSLDMRTRRALASRLWNRLIVLPDLRTVLCAIDKNGLTVQNAVARAIHRDPHPEFTGSFFGAGGFRFAPDRYDIDAAAAKRLVADSGWRRIIVHRSPLDRFVSAYNSKCRNADGDGRRHCWDLFGGENVSMSEVATWLLANGIPNNPHWLPQAHFCGGLAGATYTHAIPFDQMATLLPRAFGPTHADVVARVNRWV